MFGSMADDMNWMDQGEDDYDDFDSVQCGKCYHWYHSTSPFGNVRNCPVCGSDEVVGDR